MDTRYMLNTLIIRLLKRYIICPLGMGQWLRFRPLSLSTQVQSQMQALGVVYSPSHQKKKKGDILTCTLLNKGLRPHIEGLS